MTRGNQREMDRAKNLKKQQTSKKERDVPEGQSLQNVKLQYTVTVATRLVSPHPPPLSDAEIMRKKQAEAAARKQETEKTPKESKK